MPPSTQVDAALDLSHTQNIGRMIKSHFPHSQVHVCQVLRLSTVSLCSFVLLRLTLQSVAAVQFIVVSLKEGMFTNANVIFRTKFVDGVSTVTRTLSGKQ